MTRKSDAARHICVFGLGWGDEGKGKVVDLLGASFDVVVRFNGGANAGHTVRMGGESFALHLLPTGLLRENVAGVIGPGVVVDPLTLIDEIDNLQSRGIDVTGRLKISDRAHLVLAYHKVEDRLSEGAAEAKERIGTTARGIGPCYADKAKRNSAVRFTDLLHDPGLPQRIRQITERRSAALRAMYGDDGGLHADDILADLHRAVGRLRPFVCDTTSWLHDAMGAGRRMLFEGANGVLLDVDHGTYPFVTSSSTGPHGLAAGSGVAPQSVGRFVGTIKAYATRVGAGPFVSELSDEVGDRIRDKGHEFGTTTGRPRRCGWFDAVATRYAAKLTGCTDVSLMHLDTLGGFDRVGICIAYRLDGVTMEVLPADPRVLEEAQPVIEYVPGWEEDVSAARRIEDLPANALNYIRQIESLIETPVSIVSTGADRAETLIHDRLGAVLDNLAD